MSRIGRIGGIGRIGRIGGIGKIGRIFFQINDKIVFMGKKIFKRELNQINDKKR